MSENSSSPMVISGASGREGDIPPVEKSKRSSQPAVSSVEDIGNDAIKKIENESALAHRAVDMTTVTISPERLSELLEELKASMPESAKSLRFHMDEVLDRPIVTVVDKNSGSVIRQLPSEEVIRAVHNIDYMRGILFDEFS